MRAMQHTKFRAKNAKNDLKPTDFLKRNFYFETEGVFARLDKNVGLTLVLVTLHRNIQLVLSKTIRIGGIHGRGTPFGRLTV